MNTFHFSDWPESLKALFFITQDAKQETDEDYVEWNDFLLTSTIEKRK